MRDKKKAWDTLRELGISEDVLVGIFTNGDQDRIIFE